ncbi:MAG: HlyD family efflux transporter periplasmic adaptor subunit [Proteobacteria bacterium]|nr:HlyD family efflux transporter periplasmic adaptor subunit [Pseudomonadota bacterium]
MNPKPVIAAVVGVALLAGLGLWWRDAHRADETPAGTLTVYGNVDIRQVSLAFNGSERITELSVQEGDAVRAGQVLGRLDDRTLRARLQQADAQVAAAGQALARLRAGSRPEEIAGARAEVRGAESDLALAAANARRLEDVARSTSDKGVSRLDLDKAQATERASTARLDAARQSTALVVAGPRKEDIAQAAAELDGAQAERAVLQRQLDDTTLQAPSDAVVRSRLLETGDMASPQRPVYTLAIVQPKWVRAYVPERALGAVRNGVAARVTTDADPSRPIAGTVAYVSSVAEFTPKTVQTTELRTSLVYEIRVKVDDPGDRLRLGMPATVTLDVAGAASAPAK